MKQKYIFALFFLVFVVSFILFRSRRRIEEFRLPDFSVGSETSNVCPDGYVLTCVNSNLYGISETIPFPDSLPKPCDIPGFTSTPLCLPHPRNLRPPSLAYREKTS